MDANDGQRSGSQAPAPDIMNLSAVLDTEQGNEVSSNGHWRASMYSFPPDTEVSPMHAAQEKSFFVLGRYTLSDKDTKSQPWAALDGDASDAGPEIDVRLAGIGRPRRRAERCARGCVDLARDAVDTQAVRAVGRDLEHEHVGGDGQHVGQRRARRQPVALARQHLGLQYRAKKSAQYSSKSQQHLRSQHSPQKICQYLPKFG